MKLILLGAPGAGKGTQAKRISQHYDIPHISTGDIFRANIKAGTELGRKAQEYMERGALVPDALTVDMLLDRISQDDCSGGFILDGFPRTIPQAERLTEALAAMGEDIDAALDIEVPDSVIVERMAGRRVCPDCGSSYHVANIPPKKEGVCDACGAQLVTRKDDAPETVLERLATYHAQTEPLIEYYQARGRLIKVDGTTGLDPVFNEIIEKLG